jgi:hypothetical protein
MSGAKKSWAGFLLAFVLPLLAVYAWWGGFNRVEIRAASAGPYDFIYRDFAGALADLPKTQAEVERALVTAGIAPGAAITILLDDPRQVGNGKVRARVGRLLDAPVTPPKDLAIGRIEARAVIEARVHAAALLAPSKAYSALIEHLERQGRPFAPPAVEIYRPRVGSISVGDFSIEIDATGP